MKIGKGIIGDKPTTFGHHAPLQMKEEATRNNMR
jgi:hypothetical protein